MPVVRMRRTSRRVFGTRVLRSGRRVMTSSPPETDHHIKAPVTAKGGAGAGNVLETSKDVADVEFKGEESGDAELECGKRWGIVYSRKRKRLFDRGDKEKRFGKVYVRKRRFSGTRVFGVLVEFGRNGLLADFLVSVFKYLTRAEMGLSQLLGFVRSDSVARVYSSNGIRFLQDSSRNKRSGICKIFGASCYIPSFTVDFSALPSCFMYLHASFSLRSTCLPHFLFSFPTNPVHYETVRNDNMIVDEEIVQAIQQEPCISACSETYSLGIQNIPSVNISPGMKSSLKTTSVGAPRITGRSVQFKCGVITRGIQKRRSSLRSKRVKRSYALRGRMANGGLVSSMSSLRHDSLSLSPPVKTNLQLTSPKRSTSMKSSLVELATDVGSSSCSANILVVESAKCYRITEAVIILEKSVSREWSLAVKKDGKTIYRLNTRNIMRPCSSNRVTHDIIWREENNNWKLEFPDRGDWLIFKELYKECSERNMRALPANSIPVPGVQEVSDYEDTNIANFSRPNVYITIREGELSRALVRKTAIYDMDSEDEEWLEKFNEDSSLRNEHWKHVSEDSFEMIVDALEKAIFRNPDDFSDEKAAVESCLHLEKLEAVEAVYGYWMRKRKQKRSALVQVFQFYQPRRTQPLSKPFIRKKRSFKRQPSRPENSKQRTFIPVVAPEPDPMEEQKALRKVEEAKAATARSVDAAIEKRKKAQLLMEKADLATYKAAVALRIAEAAQIAESFDVSDSFLLE